MLSFSFFLKTTARTKQLPLPILLLFRRIAPGRMTEILLAVVEHVPLLVYGESGHLTKEEDLKRSEGDKLWNLSSSISSVYFDSPSMSLYNGRVNVSNCMVTKKNALRFHLFKTCSHCLFLFCLSTPTALRGIQTLPHSVVRQKAKRRSSGLSRAQDPSRMLGQ